MPADRDLRRQIDREFFGLRESADPCRTTFVVGPHLARFDGALYGGTAIAVSLAAME
jgi:hypothetical protein